MVAEREIHTGPICLCGHPVAGHFLAGCLDTQWFDETSDVFCPCERTEDEAQAAAARAEAVEQEGPQ